MSEQEKLKKHFRGMESDGLVDVRFCFDNLDGATTESVCGEVNRLYDTIESGHWAALDFGDLRLRAGAPMPLRHAGCE